MLEHLPNMHKGLGSVSNPDFRKRKGGEWGENCSPDKNIGTQHYSKTNGEVI